MPHPAVPEWERRSVRAVAYQRDLYTSLMSGDEADEFERWIAALGLLEGHDRAKLAFLFFTNPDFAREFCDKVWDASQAR